MSRKALKVSLRTIVIGIVFVINSLVLYVPSVYYQLYDYYTFIAVFMLFVSVYVTSHFRIERKVVIISLLIIIIGLIDIQFNKLPIGEFFPLIWFFILMYCFRELKQEEVVNPVFSSICLFFWTYLLIYSFAYHQAFIKMFNSQTVEGILNPNTVGTGIAQFAILYGSTNRKIVNNKHKHQIVIVAFSFVGFYMCNSRAAAIFFMLACVIGVSYNWLCNKHLLLFKSFTLLSVAFGFVFPYIIIGLWRRLGFGVSFLGKQLFTGRERIWSTLFDYMKAHPSSYLWGTGKIESIYWHDKFNLHNAYLALFAEYGLIVSIAFWGLLLFVLFKRYDGSKKTNGKSIEVGRNIGFIVFVFYSLFTAYTETNFTYILSIIYIAFAFGRVAGRTYDT